MPTPHTAGNGRLVPLAALPNYLSSTNLGASMIAMMMIESIGTHLWAGHGTTRTDTQTMHSGLRAAAEPHAYGAAMQCVSLHPIMHELPAPGRGGGHRRSATQAATQPA